MGIDKLHLCEFWRIYNPTKYGEPNNRKGYEKSLGIEKVFEQKKRIWKFGNCIIIRLK
jgi:hypothetical protein